MSDLVVQQNRSLAFEPQNLSEAHQICVQLVKSGFLPKAIRTPEQALAILMTGRELGLAPMQSFRSIHIIEGKPSMSADLIVAMCKKHPECEYFRRVESSDERAVYECKRKGSEPVSASFTFKQAQNAGITGKDNWRKYPAAMLRARCKADLARDEFPDLVMGIYDPEELDAVHAVSSPPDPIHIETLEPAPEQPTIPAAPNPPSCAAVEKEIGERLTGSSGLASLKRVAATIADLGLDEAAKGRLRKVYLQKEKSFERPKQTRTKGLEEKLTSGLSPAVTKALTAAKEVRTKEGSTAWHNTYMHLYRTGKDNEREAIEQAVMDIDERISLNIKGDENAEQK